MGLIALLLVVAAPYVFVALVAPVLSRVFHQHGFLARADRAARIALTRPAIPLVVLPFVLGGGMLMMVRIARDDDLGPIALLVGVLLFILAIAQAASVAARAAQRRALLLQMPSIDKQATRLGRAATLARLGLASAAGVIVSWAATSLLGW